MANLKDLLVDGDLVDEAELAEAIINYARIDRNTGSVQFLAAWDELGVRARILVYLLARKAARVVVPVDGYEEAQTPSDIADCTGIDGNTIRPTLSIMVKDRLLSKDDRKRYHIPGHVLRVVRSLITNEKGSARKERGS